MFVKYTLDPQYNWHDATLAPVSVIGVNTDAGALVAAKQLGELLWIGQNAGVMTDPSTVTVEVLRVYEALGHYRWADVVVHYVWAGDQKHDVKGFDMKVEEMKEPLVGVWTMTVDNGDRFDNAVTDLNMIAPKDEAQRVAGHMINQWHGGDDSVIQIQNIRVSDARVNEHGVPPLTVTHFDVTYEVLCTRPDYDNGLRATKTEWEQRDYMMRYREVEKWQVF